MSSSSFSLIEREQGHVPDAAPYRFGLVVSDWNDNITEALRDAALSTLKQYGAREENILLQAVPGSFELIYGSAQMARSGRVDAVIAIGCVIRGDTPHFDFICQGVTQGLAELNATGEVPIVFGLLTTNTSEQAEERAGGIIGNKGDEYAITAIKMAEMARAFKK